jgi:hypothetical protein
MATYYARPNLMDLGDVTGWSLTSGGPSANAKPGDISLGTAIFDSNSGPRRTITGGFGYAAQVIMSVPMDFAATLKLMGDCILKGTAKGVQLTGYGGNDNNSNIYTLDASQCVIGSSGLDMWSIECYWKLVGNLTTTGQISIIDTTDKHYLYSTPGSTITCSYIILSGTDGSGVPMVVLFTGGSLNLVLTGAANSNLPNVNSPGTITVTVTDQSATVKTLSLAAGTSWSIINNTGNGQGTGGLQLGGGATSFGTFDCGKNAAVTIFPTGVTYAATSWIMDGSGQHNLIKSITTTPATLAKTGGGTIAANFCNFNYINAATSPATAIRATNSKLTGGGTGITLVAQTSRFMPFF